MRIKLDKGAYAPVRVHDTDAGLDVRAMHGGTIPAKGSMTFKTGVHVELPEGTAGVLLPKSGLMTKQDVITFGVVDQEYRGEVMVHAFNLSDEPYWVEAGDKISQMLVLNVRCEPVEIVDELNEGARGDKGFGSSGR